MNYEKVSKIFATILIMIGIGLIFIKLNPLDRVDTSDMNFNQEFVLTDAFDGAKKNNLDVAIKMDGTYSALESLANGSSEIAIVAMPRGRKLPDGLVALPFAYQAAVVVVNSVNPIEEITTKQLFDIYSIAAKNRAETWQQLGVKNIGLRNIAPITTNLSDNVVVELFKALKWNGK